MKGENLFVHGVEYYKAKLSELAQDVIEPNPDFPFGIKENKSGSDTIVEQHGDCFKIYRIESLKGFLGKSLTTYYSTISFNDEKINIETKMKRKALYFFIVWVVFLLSFMAILLVNDNFGGLLFIFILVAALAGLPIGKRRFNNFTIQFINTL
jgi:hypothetical protein